MMGMGGGAPSRQGTDKRSVNREEKRKEAIKSVEDAKGPSLFDPYFNIVEVKVYGQARFYNSPPEEPEAEPSLGETAGDASKPEPGKDDAAADASKGEPSKVEAPKAAAAEGEPAKNESAAPEPPKAGAPKGESPKAEAPKAAPAGEATKKTEAPKS